MKLILNRQGTVGFHRSRTEKSEKRKLLSMAATAIKNDPKLTRSEFMKLDSVKRLELCSKSVFIYLDKSKFAHEPKKMNKKEKTIVDVWDKGYQASKLGQLFHQKIATRMAQRRD